VSFAIGIEHPKRGVNVGTLLRSAFNLGAALVFTVGQRYDHQGGDTVKAWRHIPVMHFATWAEYRVHAPFGWTPVGIEIGRAAVDLRDYHHPREAVYILGAEDHGLTNEAAALCKDLVVIPSRLCLNVAVAGSIVMYDRLAKTLAAQREDPR
jgi:tRNA (guanosine-2'-O-)-methyltransferase